MTMEMKACAVNVKEARRLLGGLGRNKFYELLAEGKLRSIRVGNRYLIPVSAISAFLGEQADEKQCY